MPSPLTVPVARIDKLLPHSNADRLEIAHVLGWQCVVGKGSHAEGDVVVYFPVDTVIPEKWSDAFGVTQYLNKGRVRACRLRGEKSFGLVVRPEKQSWRVGDNVADFYGATKYAPPVRPGRGSGPSEKRLAELAGFPQYTNINNARHYPDLLGPDETIVITEKIHGTNSRVGMVNGTWVAGSHRVRRNRPLGFLVAGEIDTAWKRTKRAICLVIVAVKKKLRGMVRNHWLRRTLGLYATETSGTSLYWYPLSKKPVADMIRSLAKRYASVSVYGEIYGPGIQGLTYGIPEGQYGYRVFDIKVDGTYLDYDELCGTCYVHDVDMVSALYIGSRSNVNLANMSEGPTTLPMSGRRHIREGVVVKPIRERTDPKIGRVVLKYVSDTYLLSDTTDFAEE